MACDSQSTKPSSSMVGTRAFGFIFLYSGVFTTPYCMPASMRSYLRPSSSIAHSAFFTFTELVRPQIFSISTLETDCLTVSARIARREIAAVELPDELRGSELVVVVDRDDAMAAALQLFQRRGREARFLDADVHALHEAKARAVAGRLRALAIVGDAHHHLGVALRLHGAAHETEAHHRASVAGDEAGDDGLVRPLARRDAVRMSALQHEGAATVLQRDALDHHARAEAQVIRLDEGNHHSRGVRCSEVHGAGLGRRAMAEMLGALEINQLRPRAQVLLVEQRFGAHIHVVDVA